MGQLSVREAAAALGVHPARVTHWLATGKLQAEWVDGPRGRSPRIDESALTALRRAQDKPESRTVSDPEHYPALTNGAVDVDSLARARAVESYTAGLAATAIAPAVARLVETIEQLTRDNGDLREEIGALKARLEAHSSEATDPADDGPDSNSGPAPAGLVEEQWEELRERLDRLSQPLPTQEPPRPASPPDLQRRSRRPRPTPPWTRIASWIRSRRD